MANIKVTEMPTTTSVNDEDYIMLVQNNTSKKIAMEDLEKYNKNIMTASLTNNYTLISSGTYEQLTLSSSENIGNNLSIDTGGIKCSKVGYVKVSAKLSFNSCGAGLKWLTIYKNTTAISAMPFNTTTNRITLSIPPILVPVSTNDVFYMSVQGSSGDIVRNNSSYTEMTVEYI